MHINKLHSLTLSLLLFSACSTQKVEPPKDTNLTLTGIAKNSSLPPKVTKKSNVISEPKVNNEIKKIKEIKEIVPPQPTITPRVVSKILELRGDFAGNFKLIDFIEYMHNQYQFKREYLYKLFSNAKDLNQVIDPCTTRDKKGHCIIPIKPQGKWDRYRAMFIYERNINRGVEFWNEHESKLNQAYQVYGVPPEFIIGILGVETAYGVNFGKKKVIDVLTSKAMLGDRRENFYTTQLEKYLIMTRQSGLDPATLMGSNAGAMGYGQFIASSYLQFAVDFNDDGVIDLWNADDAIGSIANYFAKNGWNSNIRQVAVRAKYKGERFNRLETGYKTKYSQRKLRKKYHILPRQKLYYRGSVSLIKLPKYSYDELWLGTHNFRVITTYNHSTFYGMAVYQLGKVVKNRRYGR